MEPRIQYAQTKGGVSIVRATMAADREGARRFVIRIWPQPAVVTVTKAAATKTRAISSPNARMRIRRAKETSAWVVEVTSAAHYEGSLEVVPAYSPLGPGRMEVTNVISSTSR